jgi:hypothetical protein
MGLILYSEIGNSISLFIKVIKHFLKICQSNYTSPHFQLASQNQVWLEIFVSFPQVNIITVWCDDTKRENFLLFYRSQLSFRIIRGYRTMTFQIICNKGHFPFQ